MLLLLELFWSFFQVGLFGFGGGYAALPLIQDQIVDLHHWLNPEEFSDLITISQMTPGPIAINSATFVGLRMAGLPGALIATLGNVLPCFIIVLGLAWIYKKYANVEFMKRILFGLRPAIIALIASAGVSILITALNGAEATSLDLDSMNLISLLLFLLSFLCYRLLKKIDPTWIMLFMGIAGGIIFYFTGF